jgi:flavin-binding protein dodecin
MTGTPGQEPLRLHLVIGCEVTTSYQGRLARSTKMKNHVYKILEIVGSSQTSIEDAINTAVELAGKTIRNMDWFEVVETRGHIKDGKIAHYQVTLKIGFTLEMQ